MACALKLHFTSLFNTKMHAVLAAYYLQYFTATFIFPEIKNDCI